MSYVSIALLRWSGENETHNNKNAKFLILKETKWQFWECSMNSIGARFNRDWFEKRLTKDFNFDFKHTNFKYLDSKEYEGEDKPPCSAYMIDISSDLHDVINELVNQPNSKYHWKNFEEITKLIKEWKSSQKFLIDNANSGKILPSPPEFTNDFLTTIEQIQDAKSQGNLVIFVGAGISKNSGVPLWGELLKELQKLIPDGESESEPLVIPQLYYNQVEETQYHKTIQKLLRHNEVKFDNKLHKTILSLKPAHIITTNYDNLIEQAMEYDTESLNYSLICEDKDLPFAESSNFLVKMHGDFDKKNIVLKEDDYLHYQQNFPLIENFIKGVFSSKLVLFIGFSYSDLNLKFIVERVRNVLQKNYQPAFIFDTNPTTKVSKQKIEYFKKRGVQIVNYDDKIETYLKERKRFDKIQNENNPRGQVTNNFLQFINYYNRSTERNKNLHIIDQMYNALEKYDEFQSIPPKLLGKIPPFSVGEKIDEYAKYNSSGFHFQTKNETIIKLLKNIAIEDGKVKFNDKKFEIELNNKVYNPKDKLESIFRKLNRTPIFCIQRKDDNLSDNHYRIHLTTKEECTCSRCKFRRLEIDELLPELNNKAAYNYAEEECESEFNKAYVHFFIGNVLTAYRILNQISFNSFKERKFITYFFAKYNISQILWRVKSLSVPSEISLIEKNEVLKKIENNDIHGLISTLPLDEITKKTLHEIENGKMIKETRIEMEKRLTSIKNLNKQYKNENSHFSGPNQFQIFYDSFIALRVFLNTNFCYEIIYHDFQNLAHMLWEGALISHSTSDAYELKLKEFDYYLFDVAIFNLHTEDFAKLFLIHHPSNISAKPETINKLIKRGLNLFSSNHKKNNLFGKTVNAKSPFLIQKEKSIWFKQRMRRYGCNILILLSHLDLSKVPKVNLDDLIEATLNYLDIEGQGFGIREKYFANFYAKAIPLSLETRIPQLIHTILSDNLWTNEFIKPVCESLFLNHPKYKIEKVETLEKIINRTTYRRKFQIDIEDILPFFNLLNNDLKVTFKEEIIKSIFQEEKINWKLYLMTANKNIIEFNQKKLFDKYLKNHLSLLKPLKFSKSANQYYFTSERVVHFLEIYYINQVKLTKQQQKLIKRKNTDNFLKWILQPKDFNYDDFDTRWIILVSHIENVINIISKLKIQALKKNIQKSLKKNHQEKLSEIYWKYF